MSAAKGHITDALPAHTREDLLRFSDGEIDSAIILGSGLGDFASRLEVLRSVSTTELPGYPQSTVPGHAGKLHLCSDGSRRLLLFQGRVHGYEGYAHDVVALPARIAAELGARILLVTNAAGGLHPSLDIGDLMLITDVLALPVSSPAALGFTPGTRSPQPLPQPLLSPSLIDTARKAAVETQTRLREGTYGFCSGPTYETKAEITFFRMAGVDAVGMSTYAEIIAARRLGLDVLGISCITNKAQTVGNAVSHAEVTAVGASVSDRFSRLVHGIIRTW
jgi:purine-nucleoside phosphorylase